ncbi:hypothetical protein TNCV_2454651 [Trichonephila clavipes]|nr:hypothetical protein TNCV_2454651 [Trichonephila clavipes]
MGSQSEHHLWFTRMGSRSRHPYEKDSRTLQLYIDFCQFHLLYTPQRGVVDEWWRDEDGTRAAPEQGCFHSQDTEKKRIVLFAERKRMAKETKKPLLFLQTHSSQKCSDQVISLRRIQQCLAPQESLIFIYRPTERLSRPYSAWDLNTGPESYQSKNEPVAESFVVVSNLLGAGKPTPSPLILSVKECHKPDPVPGIYPSSPEDEQEKQRTGIERLYPLL